MSNSIALPALKLILGSTLFTKAILVFLVSLSIISWAIILNKYFYIVGYKTTISGFVTSLTRQANIKLIEESCNNFSNSTIRTVPIILLKLIKSQNEGRQILSPESIINNAVMFEFNRLQKWMGLLATTASTSPLIGLLGTVYGIMYSFISIQQMGNATIATVAPGIAEALMTTIAGLCVAIPASAGHNFLSMRINNCLDQLERISEFTKDLFSKGTKS
ncbi:MAG: MotA/TolQ/ExbB proton channel family protein [Candidatus Latescibacteria bacterium]|nr:MotA/TolQ/ExbB proton channel family protein [Candidatus Latescibacterota bacterium]